MSRSVRLLVLVLGIVFTPVLVSGLKERCTQKKERVECFRRGALVGEFNPVPACNDPTGWK